MQFWHKLQPAEMHVYSSKRERKQPFFRTNEGIQSNGESMADDKPVDGTTAKPVSKPTVELPGKPKKPVRNGKRSRRGYGNKNKRKNNGKYEKFSLLGTNAAGLKCKKESFFRVINKLSPSVITIQESKMSKPGMIKLPGYQVKVGDKNIRIINGYGPQKDDNIKDVLNFWHEIEAEVVKAKDENCMIIIEMDANAKVGKDVIKKDPHTITNNGKLLLDMVERQNLCILNAKKISVLEQ